MPDLARTDADCTATDSLFTRDELNRSDASRPDEQILAKSRADEETWLGTSPTTGTPLSPTPDAGPSTPEFDDLMDRYRARQRDELVGWSCQYRKRANEIGSGGQGVVYLMECADEFFGNRALKVFCPQPYGDAQAYHTEMERMKTVAAVVHQICHGNLILVERFESDSDIYMMVMRLIDGYDLQSLLKRSTMQNLEPFVTTCALGRTQKRRLCQVWGRTMRSDSGRCRIHHRKLFAGRWRIACQRDCSLRHQAIEHHAGLRRKHQAY